MKEDERAADVRKSGLISRARKCVLGILISCLGPVLVVLFLITGILGENSVTAFLQDFSEPRLLVSHSIVFLPIPAFMLVGYLYAKQKNLAESLEQSREQVLKSERMAAIGELATMVGHDLRNPLQSIENATYYLNNELTNLSTSVPISQKTTEMLQVINDSITYADRIIRDLQDFSATKAPALKETDVNTLVAETLSQAQIPENIELRTELGYIPWIKADKDQIKRVFLNLITNAIQAMENGGTLTASTKKTEGWIEVSFKDTGVGISKENMEKLFSPLFSTRAKGVGMGLPICKKFVESHGGRIEVESQVGKGTTFTVRLPTQQEMEVEIQ